MELVKVPRDAEYLRAFGERYGYAGPPLPFIGDDSLRMWDILRNARPANRSDLVFPMTRIVANIYLLSRPSLTVPEYTGLERNTLEMLDVLQSRGARSLNEAVYDQSLGMILGLLVTTRRALGVTTAMPPPVAADAPSAADDEAFVRGEIEAMLGERVPDDVDERFRAHRLVILPQLMDDRYGAALAMIDSRRFSARRAWLEYVKPAFLGYTQSNRAYVLGGVMDLFRAEYGWRAFPLAAEPIVLPPPTTPMLARLAKSAASLVAMVARSGVDFFVTFSRAVDRAPSGYDIVSAGSDAVVNALVTVVREGAARGVNVVDAIVARGMELAERAGTAAVEAAAARLYRAIDQGLAAELAKIDAYAETKRRMSATYVPVPAAAVVWDDGRLEALAEQGRSHKIGTLSKALLAWSQRRDDPLDRIFEEGALPSPVALAMLERQSGPAGATWVRLLAAWTGETRSAEDARHLVPLVHYLRRAVFQALVTYWAHTITGARTGTELVRINSVGRDVLGVMLADAPALPLDETMLVELPGGRMQALNPGVAELDQVIVTTPVSPDDANASTPGLVYNLPLPFVLDQWTPLRREWDVQLTMRPVRRDPLLWDVDRRLYMTSLKRATEAVYVQRMIDPTHRLVPVDGAPVILGMDGPPNALWHWLSGRFSAPEWDHLERDNVLMLVRFAMGLGTELPREIARYDVLLPEDERRLYSSSR